MIIGVPKEIKSSEYRVGLTPSVVRDLVLNGHQVVVETKAGQGIGYSDACFHEHGAKIVADSAEIFGQADMVVKVKEPQPEECRMVREGQILFTYLHLAPDPVQAKLLQASGCTAIAYETVTDAQGALPLLVPMSQVAGRMAVQAGAHCLEKCHGGRGVLLGGVPGVYPATIVVIGAGIVGTNAIRMAIGLGAQVVVMDRDMDRLRQLDAQYGALLHTVYSTRDSIEQHIAQADLVIGAVLIVGDSAPKLITREQLSRCQDGAVLVDVAIDQGGCFETSRPTTHEEPTYVVDDIVHYCVANMPAGVPLTATHALNNATHDYVHRLANQGVAALREDPHFRSGLNIHQGHFTHNAVARALNQPFLPAEEALRR